jgi:hypothetical protein
MSVTATVPATDQNPLSLAALRRCDVQVDVHFKCYEPGNGATPIVEGVFTSEPYYDECWTADVRLQNGNTESYQLYDLGITRGRYKENEWLQAISIEVTDGD